MKKFFAYFFTVLLVLCMFPAVSFAATNFTPADGSTFDLAACSNGDTITIAAGTSVNVSNITRIPTLTNFQIICEAGSHLTLQVVTIDNSAYPGLSPITFTGTGNTFEPAGGNAPVLIGGASAPGILVADGTELTITGTSAYSTSVHATGGESAAGIGGGDAQSGGTVTVEGTTVTAVGGSGGAGIGGGAGGDGGTVKITSGTVTATGSGGGAGIGGGSGGNGGAVDISNGTVTATGGDTGAGIGGGSGGSTGDVTVSYGIVTASGTGGAGIGGGGGSTGGAGGDVTISGGAVFANSTNGADIGGGYNTGTASVNGAGGTIGLSNTGGLTLSHNGTNAVVTRGTCAIGGAGAGSYAGIYFNGTPYTSGEGIDVASASSGIGYSYSSTVLTIDTNGEYLVWNATASNRVVVASGVEADIILFGTNINASSASALDISGATADITLTGNSTLASGLNCAGLRCPDGAALTVSGDGTLNATGGGSGAGIGGSSTQKGGSMTFLSGTVNATNVMGTGSYSGAGIGGGGGAACGTVDIRGGTINATCANVRRPIRRYEALGGAAVYISGGTVTATNLYGTTGIGGYSDRSSTIKISGGTVTATGSNGGMGIGGYGTEEPFVNISGGTVTAKSVAGGAGIGGMQSANGGVINISGGTVFAQGSYGGAAIGGSYTGSSGTITISGGTVYASGDSAYANDIGSGTGSTTGTLAITGTARVFLQNNSCIIPATTHVNETFPAGTTEVYGAAVSVPATWTGVFGAYLRKSTLSYSVNGGSGTAPEAATKLYGATANLPDGSGLSKSGYVFGGWNTAANGSGTAYAAGAEFAFTADTELFAQWTQLKLESTVSGGSASGATVYTGGRFTLTPSVDGGTWDWDHSFFSATFNSPATFTALKAGTSAITYTVDGVSVTYNVTIRQSGLPDTGQNFTWVWVLIGAALALAAFAAAALLCKQAKRV